MLWVASKLALLFPLLRPDLLTNAIIRKLLFMRVVDLDSKARACIGKPSARGVQDDYPLFPLKRHLSNPTGQGIHASEVFFLFFVVVTIFLKFFIYLQ